MYDFSGKIAVVTGAAQGLGEAIAKRFLNDGIPGVALLDLNEEVLAATAARLNPEGNRVLPVACDVSDPDSVARAFQTVERRFGAVDILVNNAGITRDAMSYKMTAGQFDAAVKVSLYGSFYCVQQVVNGMRERGYGRIVSMSSLASRGNVGQLNYASAKAGIIAMTQTLSMELGRYNITANCVAPGMINTDIIKTVPEKNMNAILSNIPMRRVGEPEEVASLVAFLASDEASYISGQCVRITGGWF